MPVKVGVAVSGGIDSLCALFLLKQAGYSVFALHALLPGANASQNLKALKNVCALLNTPLKVIDATEFFAANIIQPFQQSWRRGLTPNPCAWCNRMLKFGMLQKAAQNFGAAAFATGHYCRIIRKGNYNFLSGAKDTAKDQSYFLSLLAPEQLATVKFPLADITKDECRKIIKDAGLPAPANKESQDICFAGSGYQQILNLAVETGPIYLRAASGLKQIGMHSGLWRYTEGQRRGLGLPYSEPLYVLEKNTDTNSLVVGTKEYLLIQTILAKLVSLHLPLFIWPDQLFIRLRYRSKLVEAAVIVKNDMLKIELKEKQKPSAPGQIAAIYDADGNILAGGVIIKQS